LTDWQQPPTINQTKVYLQDINPHYAKMKCQDGMNFIDTSRIDTSNSIFVNITDLAERDHRAKDVWSCKHHHQV
jgi:hypothetical protein